MFQAKAELTKFGLIEASDGFPLPDVTPYLPAGEDNNISQHLWKVASDQVRQFFLSQLSSLWLRQELKESQSLSSSPSVLLQVALPALLELSHIKALSQTLSDPTQIFLRTM